MKKVFGIEGLDRLGKSTLIDGILNRLGFHQVIHFAKPQKLDVYVKAASRVPASVTEAYAPAYLYQQASFYNSMKLATSGAHVIFDRWHIGEVVYSPMYRKYSGDYVYNLELQAGLDTYNKVRLILLTENFETAKHFIDDGQSLGPIEKRAEEQERFLEAFNRSNIPDKRIICVTNPTTGGFRDKDDILEEALQ